MFAEYLASEKELYEFTQQEVTMFRQKIAYDILLNLKSTERSMEDSFRK